MSKARSKIKSVIFKLIRLNSTPSGIALGVALGVFIGTTPLYGFHTAMVLSVNPSHAFFYRGVKEGTRSSAEFFRGTCGAQRPRRSLFLKFGS